MKSSAPKDNLSLAIKVSIFSDISVGGTIARCGVFGTSYLRQSTDALLDFCESILHTRWLPSTNVYRTSYSLLMYGCNVMGFSPYSSKSESCSLVNLFT